jgi:hypothetical protein
MHLFTDELQIIAMLSSPQFVERVSAWEERIIAIDSEAMTVFDFDLGNVIQTPRKIASMKYSIDWDGVSVEIATFGIKNIIDAIAGVKNDVLLLMMNHDLLVFPEMRVIEGNVTKIWRLPRLDLVFLQTAERIEIRDCRVTRAFEKTAVYPSGTDFLFVRNTHKFWLFLFEKEDYAEAILRAALSNDKDCAHFLRCLRFASGFP